MRRCERLAMLEQDSLMKELEDDEKAMEREEQFMKVSFSLSLFSFWTL